jgi:hypothetical protein
MYTESRYTYSKKDQFEPLVETFQSLLDGEQVVSVKITNTMVQGECHHVQQVVLNMALTHAKLLVQKLQEGIDKHENKA